MKFHAPRWLFLVFRLRRIAFLQDTLVTVVHARKVKDSLIQWMYYLFPGELGQKPASFAVFSK